MLAVATTNAGRRAAHLVGAALVLAVCIASTGCSLFKKRPDANAAPAPFDPAAHARAAARLADGSPNVAIHTLTAGDAFYYAGGSASDFPVLRIVALDMDETRFYLDPVSAQPRFIADAGARGFRWWHLMLHRLDFVGSPVREIMVVLLMLGVTAVCGLGAWIGIRKLARGGKLDNLPQD